MPTPTRFKARLSIEVEGEREVKYAIFAFNPTRSEIHPLNGGPDSALRWMSFEELDRAEPGVIDWAIPAFPSSNTPLPRVRWRQTRATSPRVVPSAREIREAKVEASLRPPGSLPERTIAPLSQKLGTRYTNVWVARCPKPSSPIEIEVESQGERPDLVQLYLETNGEVLEYETVNPTCNDTEWVIKNYGSGTLFGSILGPTDYLNEVRKALDKLPFGPQRSASEFFFDLDCSTSGHLMEHSLSKADFDRYAQVGNTLFGVLPDRLRYRKQEHLQDEYRGFDGWGVTRGLSVKDISSALDTLEELFQRLLSTHFPAAAGSQEPIDWSALESAFESFAMGNLRLQILQKAWTTQPSSGFFFLFGELALCGAEVGEYLKLTDRRAFWLLLANVMVRTQPLFCARYGPKPGPGRLMADYSACSFDEKTPTADDLELQRQELATIASGLDLDGYARLAAKNCLEYLADE